MTALPKHARDGLADDEFGLPVRRTCPIPDANPARNAKARAADAFNKGHLTSSQRDRIDREADEVLGVS